MALHDTYESILKASLEEMLKIAFIAADTNKDDGGIYGVPATLLLFCIADAMSTWSGHKKNSLGALNDKRLYRLPLDLKMLEQIRKRYRDLLVHHLVIAPTDVLTAYGSIHDAFKFNEQGSLVVAVRPFYSLTKEAVSNFIKLMPNILDESKVPNRLNDIFIHRNK